MLSLEVSGDYACFTRPEMKVERVSYDVITPSAARAIFEAILWKPGLQWQIRRIEVLEPLRWCTMRRNEVNSRIPVRNIHAAMKANTGLLAQYTEEDRAQRAALLLRDVCYRLHAEPKLTKKAGKGDSLSKFVAMFQRRAKRGQCFHQPYLGCREFDCRFELVEDNAAGESKLTEQDLNRELGWMLYDMDFSNPAEPSPLFFKAQIDNGIVRIPDANSDEVRG